MSRRTMWKRWIAAILQWKRVKRRKMMRMLLQMSFASLYQGSDQIYYELPGRHHLRLPIPIYKCEGSGIVVLNILVNQRGDVVEFRIDPSASTTADQCLVDAATEAVRNTRFNPDDSADTRQPGTITFHFVAQ
ncbi:MAG: TonB family protein [Bacteroidales bacterium]